MKYRFKVYYINKIMNDFGNMMAEINLDIDLCALKEILTFTSTKNPSIQEIKDNIISAYQLNNCEVVHIEGGTLE